MSLTSSIPSLLSSDLAKTRAFYLRLGFEQSAAWPDRDAPRWIELRRDEVVLQFYADPPTDTPTTPVMSGTIYLQCLDLDALVDALRDRVEFAWGPETMAYGQREFAVRDPDGYFIAFAQGG